MKKQSFRSGLLFLSLLYSLTVNSGAPYYKVEANDGLCENVSNIEAYNTAFLKDNWQISEGKDGWVFSNKRDFQEQFGFADEVSKVEMKRFIQALEERGIKVIMTYVPPRGLMHQEKYDASKVNYNYAKAKANYQQAIEDFRRVGMRAPLLSSLPNYLDDRPFFLERDPHWSPIGAKITAQEVARILNELDVGQGEQEFQTSEVGVARAGGVLQRAVETICQRKMIPEYIPDFTTVEKQDTASKEPSLLFGEQNDDYVALVGTSFSDPYRYNFAGFIQEFAGINIIDYSVVGGGIDGSWLELLKSEEFQTNPPKAVIWELPGWRLFRSSQFLTLTPFVNNACEVKQSLVQQETIPINRIGQTHNILFLKDFNNIPSKNLVLDFEVSDLTLTKIELRAWFNNGSSKVFSVRRNVRADFDGRFVLSFGIDHVNADSGLLSLDVESVERDESLTRQASGDTFTGNFKICESEQSYGSSQSNTLLTKTD